MERYGIDFGNDEEGSPLTQTMQTWMIKEFDEAVAQLRTSLAYGEQLPQLEGHPAYERTAARASDNLERVIVKGNEFDELSPRRGGKWFFEVWKVATMPPAGEPQQSPEELPF